MHFLAYTPQRERFIVLLWGLLFAKCFIVEHYVQAYDVPVTSWLYVWALSISMATIASVAFLRARATERMPPQISKTVLRAWVLCLAAMACFLVGGWLIPLVSLASITVGFAIVLACGYTFQGLHSKAILDWVAAVGWWLMAALLPISAAGYSLLIFGLGLLGFVVLPLAGKLWVEWRQARAAVNALYLANDI